MEGIIYFILGATTGVLLGELASVLGEYRAVREREQNNKSR